VESELIHFPVFTCRTMDEGTKKEEKEEEEGEGKLTCR
jgi:hypothetical protein